MYKELLNVLWIRFFASVSPESCVEDSYTTELFHRYYNAVDILNVSSRDWSIMLCWGKFIYVHHGDVLSFKKGLFISIYGETVTTALIAFS